MFFIQETGLEIFLLSCCVIAYWVLFYVNKYRFWDSLGVPSAGFRKDIGFFSMKNKSYVLQDLYNEFSPYQYAGFYQASKPFLLIRDPSLVRDILIKDFSYFAERGFFFDEKLDPLKANLFCLTGPRWKNVRNKLTPAFSSAKLKLMLPLMQKCNEALDRYLEKTAKESPELEVRDLLMKYTTDIIGTCAFGISTNTVEGANGKLTEMQALMKRPFLSNFIRLNLISLCPKIFSALHLKWLPQEVEDFIFALTREAKKYRAENANKRRDILQLLINAQHEELETLRSQNDDSEPLFTDNILAAHVFIFFFAGLESTASTLAYCLYELALNQDVMERLHHEIKTNIAKNGGKLDYECLKGMRFMDCVIAEVQRMHPVSAMIQRVCSGTYQIPNSSFKIIENMSVAIPVYALHRDPEYFESPEKFTPERFDDKNRHKIIPGTYLPFGEGPRLCLGIMFAQMEMKAALTLIIGNYTVHPTKKTQIPLKFKPSIFNAPERGIYLQIEKREDKLISH